MAARVTSLASQQRMNGLGRGESSGRALILEMASPALTARVPSFLTTTPHFHPPCPPSVLLSCPLFSTLPPRPWPRLPRYLQQSPPTPYLAPSLPSHIETRVIFLNFSVALPSPAWSPPAVPTALTMTSKWFSVAPVKTAKIWPWLTDPHLLTLALDSCLFRACSQPCR